MVVAPSISPPQAEGNGGGPHLSSPMGREMEEIDGKMEAENEVW